MRDVQLQQILEAVCAAGPTSGNVVDDIRNGSEDIAGTVSQQSRGLDVIHLSDFTVQLDKPSSGLSAGDSVETLFHNGTLIRLAWWLDLKKEN